MKLYKIIYDENNASKEHNRMCFITKSWPSWSIIFGDSANKVVDSRVDGIRLQVQSQRVTFDIAKNWIDNGIISYAGHEFNVNKMGE